VANEGRFVAFAPRHQEEEVLKILREFSEGKEARSLARYLIDHLANSRCKECFWHSAVSVQAERGSVAEDLLGEGMDANTSWIVLKFDGSHAWDSAWV